MSAEEPSYRDWDTYKVFHPKHCYPTSVAEALRDFCPNASYTQAYEQIVWPRFVKRMAALGRSLAVASGGRLKLGAAKNLLATALGLRNWRQFCEVMEKMEAYEVWSAGDLNEFFHGELMRSKEHELVSVPGVLEVLLPPALRRSKWVDGCFSGSYFRVAIELGRSMLLQKTTLVSDAFFASRPQAMFRMEMCEAATKAGLGNFEVVVDAVLGWGTDGFAVAVDAGRTHREAEKAAETPQEKQSSAQGSQSLVPKMDGAIWADLQSRCERARRRLGGPWARAGWVKAAMKRNGLPEGAWWGHGPSFPFGLVLQLVDDDTLVMLISTRQEERESELQIVYAVARAEVVRKLRDAGAWIYDPWVSYDRNAFHEMDIAKDVPSSWRTCLCRGY